MNADFELGTANGEPSTDYQPQRPQRIAEEDQTADER